MHVQTYCKPSPSPAPVTLQPSPEAPRPNSTTSSNDRGAAIQHSPLSWRGLYRRISSREEHVPNQHVKLQPPSSWSPCGRIPLLNKEDWPHSCEDNLGSSEPVEPLRKRKRQESLERLEKSCEPQSPRQRLDGREAGLAPRRGPPANCRSSVLLFILRTLYDLSILWHHIALGVTQGF